MVNDSINKDIDPRLENLLKEELIRRAKKIEAINKWKHSDPNNLRLSTSQDPNRLKVACAASNNNRFKKNFASVSGIAAMLLVGFFLMGYLFVSNPNPNLEVDGVPSFTTAEPIFRGALIDPSIYIAIEEGDTIQAICLLDSAIQICQSNLHQLDSIASISKELDEIQEIRTQTEAELNELIELKNTIIHQ